MALLSVGAAGRGFLGFGRRNNRFTEEGCFRHEEELRNAQHPSCDGKLERRGQFSQGYSKGTNVAEGPTEPEFGFVQDLTRDDGYKREMRGVSMTGDVCTHG